MVKSYKVVCSPAELNKLPAMNLVDTGSGAVDGLTISFIGVYPELEG
jgi:hypothetical protein